MFVQYSFVERRNRPEMRSEPMRLSDNAMIALAAAFMIAVSIAYIAIYGVI